jgi:integrase
VTEFQRVQVEKGIRQIGPSRWEVQVHIGRDPSTNKLRQVSRTTRKGIADARKLRARLMTEVAEGKHGNTAGTFGSLLDEWISQGERNGRSPNTIAGYRIKINKTIRPELGALPLNKLTTHRIDSFYGRLLDNGTSPATVMHYHRIISAALHQAQKWGWVDRNAASLAQPPTVPKKELTIPPPDRVRALIELAATSRSPEWSTVITLAALTGVRRGELCGLKWADVDWQNSSLMIRRSIWQTAAGWGEKDPKSHQIRRLILGKHAMAALGGRWERMRLTAEALNVTLSENAYVFGDDIDGAQPLLPGAVTRAFSRLCHRMESLTLKSANESGRDLRDDERWPYRFHDLRHYTASELFRAGHNPRTVADRLGHADPSITLKVYTHDTADQALAAATSLEAGLLAARVRPGSD